MMLLRSNSVPSEPAGLLEGLGCDRVPEGSPEEPEGAHLPAGVVRNIAGFLVHESANLLNLLAMAGVCKSWRAVARELSGAVSLGYEGFDNAFSTSFSSQSSVQRFRKLAAKQKEQVFVAAARFFTGKAAGGGGSSSQCRAGGSTHRVLLQAAPLDPAQPAGAAAGVLGRAGICSAPSAPPPPPHPPSAGYTQATFSGDGTTDTLLSTVAGCPVGPELTRVRLTSSSNVTDVGLTALISRAPCLTSVELEDLARSNAGREKVGRGPAQAMTSRAKGTRPRWVERGLGASEHELAACQFARRGWESTA
jgi:hypothetical protein